MAGNSQSDVDTNSVNTYNSMQLSSPLMDNNVSNVNSTPASDTNVKTENTDSSLIENLAGTPPVVESNAPVEQFPQQESSDTVPPVSAEMPSFGSIPVMGEPVASSPVSEQAVATETSMQSPTLEQPAESSFDMSTPLSQPVASTSVSQSNFSPNTPSEPVAETPSTPAFNETEIVNTLGNEKKEKEGGNTVVIILIIVIVALLIAVGYFAYKVFLA